MISSCFGGSNNLMALQEFFTIYYGLHQWRLHYDTLITEGRVQMTSNLKSNLNYIYNTPIYWFPSEQHKLLRVAFFGHP